MTQYALDIAASQGHRERRIRQHAYVAERSFYPHGLLCSVGAEDQGGATKLRITRRNFLFAATTVGGTTLMGHLEAAEQPEAAPGEALQQPASAEPSVDLLDSQKFRRAVLNGDVAAVKRYLDQDPGLMYSRDETGQSVYMLACLAGHKDVADVLAAQGLKLDIHEAAMGGNLERVTEFVTEDSRAINRQALHGGTPMHLAAQCGQAKVVEYLMFHGGDPNIPHALLKTTPLFAAADYSDVALAEQMAHPMLINGADPIAPQKQNVSPLHAAATHGSVYLTTLLIRKGADASLKSETGKTPLELAVENRHPQVAELLRDPARIPRDHSTSRFMATEQGIRLEKPTETGLPQEWINEFVTVAHFNFKRVKELLARYPELLLARATWDERAIEASAHTGHKDMVRFLLDKGSAFSLCTAVMLAMTDQVKALLQEDPGRIRERGPHDYPLMWYPMIGNTSVEVAEMLVKNGVDVNSDMRGKTALHMAAANGQIEMVRFLLAHGANVNARAKTDTGEVTPLALALKKDLKEIGQLLRAHGGES